MDFLRTEHDFWDGIAKQWSIHNKDPVVGWYDYHNQWPDYDNILFKGIATTGKVALEYGCGPGRNIIKFADPKWGFSRIDGVDISQTNIDNAWLNIQDVKGPDGSVIVKNLPNLWRNNGWEIGRAETYDIVFSVIALQHVQSWSVRQKIFCEIYGSLKPGGWFTAQMGFGAGHPRSVGYYDEPEAHTDKDVRVESAQALSDDLAMAGFKNFTYELREPCKDEHPYWIWFKCQK